MSSPTPRAQPARRTQRAAVLGLLANVALAIAKLVAGVVGASYALIADAVESFTDIVSSVVIWGGLHMAARPPDENHPYGHGKIESLAAFAVAVMIGVAGLGVATQAIRGLFEPQTPPASWTLIVLLVVIVIKEALARLTARAARRESSTAGRIESWHHRTDAFTSLVAALGIGISVLGGPRWAAADEWAALFASAIILFNAASLGRLPYQELTDAEPTEIISEAARLAMTVSGVLAVETLHARRHGRDMYIDLHIEVDPELSVREAHRLAHKAQDAIRDGLPQVRRVLVHVEPHEARPASV